MERVNLSSSVIGVTICGDSCSIVDAFCTSITILIHYVLLHLKNQIINPFV